MNNKILYTTGLISMYILFVLSIMSCSNDGTILSSSKDEGRCVEIGVDANGFSETTTRSLQTSPEVITQELDNGQVLEASIQKESILQSRSTTTTALADGVKILVLAYRNPGSSETLYKSEVATVSSGKITVHLPEGEAMHLVFYSYGSATAPSCPYSGTSGGVGTDSKLYTNTSETTQSETAKPVMWTDAQLSSTATSISSITFTHLFSQIEIGTVSSAAYIYSFDAKLDGTSAWANASVNLHTNAWTGSTTATPSVAISTSLSSGATSISSSSYTDFIPNTDNKLKLNVTIGYGTGMSTRSLTITSTNNITKATRYKVSFQLVDQFLFSDGTYGTLSNNTTKTPVAILVSNSVSSTDKASGYKYYAMSLNDASSTYKWTTTTNNAPYTPAITSATENDLDGLSHTNTMYVNTIDPSPAAKAARDYSVTVSGTNHSNWFLPSAGQWYQAFINLGRVSTFSSVTQNCYYHSTDTPIYYLGATAAALCVSNLNKALSAVSGATQFTPPATQGAGRYWTSSYLCDYYAHFIYLYSPDNLWSDKLLGDAFVTKDTSYKVRSFIALK